jgi:hypothetical protein
LVVALVVLATVFAYLSILGLWANRQFLNTDNWAKTSSALLQRQAVRQQVAGFMVDQLYARVNIQGEIANALPPPAKALAGPAAGGLRNALETGIDKLLQRPRVQQLWENANRAAHRQLLAAISGGGKAVSTNGGVVTLNLGAVVAGVASRVGLGNVAGKIPPDAARITILRSKQLDAIQSALDALRGATLVLVLLTVLLLVAAVAVAQGRRREALRSAGFGLVVAGILALLTRYFAGSAVADALATTAAVRPAVADTWSVATSLLVQAAEACIAYGVVVVVAAWLAGPTRWATSTRRFLTPYLDDARIAYGALLAVLLLIVIWSPTPATRKPLGILILALLLGFGIEVLRRQTRRERAAGDTAATAETAETAETAAH